MRDDGIVHLKNIDFEGLIGSFARAPQTALLVNFVAHRLNSQIWLFFGAKSPENMAFFVRGYALDSLRWAGAFAAILSETSIASAFAASDQTLPTQRRLCSERFALGLDVRSGCGSAPDQPDRTASVQWRLFGFVGVGSFSERNNLAPVSSATVASEHSAIGSSSRSATRSVLGSVHFAIESHPGSGLRGPDALRPPARSAFGLQSQKERASLLPSGAVLRGPSSGVLAWLVATGQHFGQYRSGFLPATLPGQGPFHYGSLAPSREGRFGILWWQATGAAGAAGIGLC